MYTSYFGSLKKLPANLTPVSIALGNPKWYTGRREPRLAPTKAMLRMPREEYDRHYEQILGRLDPKEVFEALGERAVLLCWEAANVWCHRRRVAEWLEDNLGIVVVEYGFRRAEMIPYADLPAKATEASRPKSPQKELW